MADISRADTSRPGQHTIDETKQRLVEKQVSRGLGVLVIRQVIAYGTIFLGNIFLARWVTPDVYGLFAAVLAFQATLVMLSDAGLGPALIQREREPTQDELAGLFTLQLAIFGTVAAGIWLLGPWIAELAGLEAAGAWILRSLAIILCITAFRSIPALLLERELRYDAIALAETVSLVVYQIVLLVLVWLGMGITSIIWALAVRYICDLILIWRHHPWRPRCSSRFRIILPYVRFGLNMQGVRMMSYAKDQLPLLFLLPLLGPTSTGYWGWSLTYIGIPVYFNRLINRIMFPAYARVQADREAVGALATTALWLNTSVGVPILFVLVWFAPDLIPFIYGNEWLAAMPIAILLAPNMLAGFVTSAGFPILYATGKSRKALELFTIWIILTIVSLIVGIVFGNLAAMAGAFSGATLIIGIVLLLSVRHVAHINLKQALLGPILAVSGAIVLATVFPLMYLPWFIVLLATTCVYVAIICVIDRKVICNFITDYFKS